MAKIYIIAGESSGDYIGSCLMKSIKELVSKNDSSLYYNSPLSFIGIGGPLMREQGLNSLFNMSEINLMGFIEIIPKIFRLKKLIEKTAEDIILTSPSLLITIDSPGFTYRVAKRVRELKSDLKMIHVVAPSVWAYKPERALKYAKIYDHLLTLLPFEPPYFTKVGLPSTCVGHFILEQTYYSDKELLHNEFEIPKDCQVLCVTAGSRKGEIARHMPIFKGALKIVHERFPNLKIIFVINDLKYEQLIGSYLKDSELDFTCSTDRLKVFALADVALAKSGTNTLEIAASNTSMIVAYKLNPLTFNILKLLIKIKYACLINIIQKIEIIPEYIQSNCTPSKIATAIIELLESPKKRSVQVEASKRVLESLGFSAMDRPSIKAAEIIMNMLK